jgi:hypothetical protein
LESLGSTFNPKTMDFSTNYQPRRAIAGLEKSGSYRNNAQLSGHLESTQLPFRHKA